MTQAMSRDADQLASFATAEKELCEQAGPLVAGIIRDIEGRHKIRIREIRITVNPSELNGSWGGVNCVIGQADVAIRLEQNEGRGATEGGLKTRQTAR